MLGVREMLDDFVAVLRKIFDISEFVELLLNRDQNISFGDGIWLATMRIITYLRLLVNCGLPFVACASKLSICFCRANTWRLAVSDRLVRSRLLKTVSFDSSS